ncbi:hypothetical protein BN1184_BL_00090 [Pantoea ananatis]|nr:hypothetical protein BN1184_BL_00090 [Pantoea ananatis]
MCFLFVLILLFLYCRCCYFFNIPLFFMGYLFCSYYDFFVNCFSGILWFL